jgi:hypothetical protein
VASGQVVSLQPKGPKTGVVSYNNYVHEDLKLDLQGQQHFTTWSGIRQSLPKESSTILKAYPSLHAWNKLYIRATSLLLKQGYPNCHANDLIHHQHCKKSPGMYPRCQKSTLFHLCSDCIYSACCFHLGNFTNSKTGEVQTTAHACRFAPAAAAGDATCGWNSAQLRTPYKKPALHTAE